MNDHGSKGIIGKLATYYGQGSPHLRGSTVQLVSIGKPVKGLVYTCIESNDELAAAGGVQAADLIGVRVWLGSRRRPGDVLNAAKLSDLHDIRGEER